MHIQLDAIDNKSENENKEYTYLPVFGFSSAKEKKFFSFFGFIKDLVYYIFSMYFEGKFKWTLRLSYFYMSQAVSPSVRWTAI